MYQLFAAEDCLPGYLQLPPVDDFSRSIFLQNEQQEHLPGEVVSMRATQARPFNCFMASAPVAAGVHGSNDESSSSTPHSFQSRAASATARNTFQPWYYPHIFVPSLPDLSLVADAFGNNDESLSSTPRSFPSRAASTTARSTFQQWYHPQTFVSSHHPDFSLVSDAFNESARTRKGWEDENGGSKATSNACTQVHLRLTTFQIIFYRHRQHFTQLHLKNSSTCTEATAFFSYGWLHHRNTIQFF